MITRVHANINPFKSTLIWVCQVDNSRMIEGSGLLLIFQRLLYTIWAQLKFVNYGTNKIYISFCFRSIKHTETSDKV